MTESPWCDCDRGDRIRTCDLVLPKKIACLVANSVFSHTMGFGVDCHGLTGPNRLVLSPF